MKILLLLFGISCVCIFGCKKDKNVSLATFNGDGYIYNDGSLYSGGIGWYFAQSRTGQWKPFALEESQLATQFRNISTTDSIPVTISLRQTQTPVGCDCAPGSIYFYDIVSIKER